MLIDKKSRNREKQNGMPSAHTDTCREVQMPIPRAAFSTRQRKLTC